MSTYRRPHPDEVNSLIRNAQLRDELEPYLDESIRCVNVRHLPTDEENAYLESMLAWERAPTVPIREWFMPALKIPDPNTLGDEVLHEILWETIRKLYEGRIVLDFTDHLTDRELYRLIYANILPSPEKRIEARNHYLHWDCTDATNNPETWLRYYATPEERHAWSADWDEPLPPSETPPFPRAMPWHPL